MRGEGAGGINGEYDGEDDRKHRPGCATAEDGAIWQLHVGAALRVAG